MPSNTGTPDNNQRQGAAYARNNVAAHVNFPSLSHPVHGSQSAVTGERSASDGDTPPDGGLITRAITETGVLSARHQPLSHCGIKVVTAGNFRPDKASKPVGKPVICDDSDLPGGHTRQPCFWLSSLARRLLTPIRGPHAGKQCWVNDQFSMSENEARQDFRARFEHRLVGYGFTGSDASGGPEKNYGVFASTPLAKGELLGIYSGIGYAINNESWAKKNRDWRRACLHQTKFGKTNGGQVTKKFGNHFIDHENHFQFNGLL